MYEPPKFSSDGKAYLEKSYFFPRQMEDFLEGGGGARLGSGDQRDGKLVMGDAYRFAPGDEAPLPAVEIAAEDYRRLVRLADAADADARDRERGPL